MKILDFSTLLISVTISISSFCIISCKDNQSAIETVAEIEEPNIRWGINIDEYNITDGVIGQGQILSSLLAEYGIGGQITGELEKLSADVFNIRKIRAGNKYHLLQTKDSVNCFWFNTTAVLFLWFFKP